MIHFGGNVKDYILRCRREDHTWDIENPHNYTYLKVVIEYHYPEHLHIIEKLLVLL